MNKATAALMMCPVLLPGCSASDELAALLLPLLMGATAYLPVLLALVAAAGAAGAPRGGTQALLTGAAGAGLTIWAEIAAAGVRRHLGVAALRRLGDQFLCGISPGAQLLPPWPNDRPLSDKTSLLLPWWNISHSTCVWHSKLLSM